MPGHLHRKPRFYKTECSRCDLVISVRWERDYIGKSLKPNRPRPTSPAVCPLCECTQLKTFPINEREYSETNQKWDLVGTA